MPFLIYALDKPDMHVTRERVREAHRQHLQSQGRRILAAGALLDDDNATVIGGITLLDTEDRATAERFAYEDPYETVGIRKETRVVRWRQRWWSGEFLTDN
ncbi:MAG: YciI family protein [Acidiferrobacterales bacterium]